jgi:hypothetical protein
VIGWLRHRWRHGYWSRDYCLNCEWEQKVNAERRAGEDVVEVEWLSEWRSRDPVAWLVSAEVERYWDEDEFVPVSADEHAAALRETLAHARAEGWIPVGDPGCSCMICRSFRELEKSLPQP